VPHEVRAMSKLDLSAEERFKARRLKREMDEMGLPGLSEDQCFTFKGVIASLQGLSAEQLLAFRDGIAKVKSRGPIWRALQERPTLKQKQKRALIALAVGLFKAGRIEGAIRDEG
jgi:hypothetical protein